MVPLAFSLRERGVDLAEQRGLALAHADADRADGDGLIAVDQAHLGKAALLQIVGEDRIVGVAGLEAAGVHVAQDVGDGVVGLDVGEQAGLLQRVDEGGADLGADRLALQIVLRGVGLGVALRDHEAFAIGVDRIGEVDDLLARRRDEHRRRDDVDLARCQRRDQRRELHRLDLHVEAGILADFGDEVDHDALDRIGLGVEEGEGNACRRRTDLQHLLRRSRHCCGNCECRDRGQTKTLHRIPLGPGRWRRSQMSSSQTLRAKPFRPIFTSMKIWSHFRDRCKRFSCT